MSSLPPQSNARCLAAVEAQLRQTIEQPNYPCVAAVQAMARNDFTLGLYGELGAGRCWANLRADLLRYLEAQQRSGSLYSTLFAVFRPGPLDEPAFEAAMWRELSYLTSREDRATDWPATSCSDPADPTFVFSLVGHSLFVVGIHPNSSRRGRRFPFTGLIFNAFAQFEAFERKGSYERMVQLNRQRDIAFDGTVNPMVEQHGDQWEAIQFSGQTNPPTWQCPFRFLSQIQKP